MKNAATAKLWFTVLLYTITCNHITLQSTHTVYVYNCFKSTVFKDSKNQQILVCFIFHYQVAEHSGLIENECNLIILHRETNISHSWDIPTERGKNIISGFGEHEVKK